LVDVLVSSTSFHAHPVNTPYDAKIDAVAHVVAPQAVQDGKQDMATKAAQLGVTAAAWVRSAGQAASDRLQQGAQHMTQNSAPTSHPVQISYGTLKMLDYGKSAASGVAKVTGKVAGGLASAAIGAVSGAATMMINNPLTRGMHHGLKQTGMDVTPVTNTAVAAVIGLDEVLQALQEAGVQVARSAATATTTVVDHKYGQDAARAAHLTMGSAVHVVEAQKNLGALRPTRIVKKAAQKTASQLAADHRQRHGGTADQPI